MSTVATECEVLIPLLRSGSYFCLGGGIAVLVAGAGLALFTQDPQLGDLAKFGGGALSSVGLIPFGLYYRSHQSLKFVQMVKRLADRGDDIPPAMQTHLETLMAQVVT